MSRDGCSVNFAVQVGPKKRNRFTFRICLSKDHVFSEALFKWGVSLCTETDAENVPELTAFFDQTFEKTGGDRLSFGAIVHVSVDVSTILDRRSINRASVRLGPLWEGPYSFPNLKDSQEVIKLDVDAILKGFANGRNIKSSKKEN